MVLEMITQAVDVSPNDYIRHIQFYLCHFLKYAVLCQKLRKNIA